jgi:hypothetical protein
MNGNDDNVKQILIGQEVRKAEIVKYKLTDANASHLLKKKRIVNCLVWVA